MWNHGGFPKTHLKMKQPSSMIPETEPTLQGAISEFGGFVADGTEHVSNRGAMTQFGLHHATAAPEPYRSVITNKKSAINGGFQCASKGGLYIGIMERREGGLSQIVV
jgi:hypothetical protein